MLVVDTNLLVHAANATSPVHQQARAWLELKRFQPDSWYATWPILFEFMRVVTHPRVIRPPWTIERAWAFVSALLASPGLGLLVPTERHAQVAAQVFKELPSLAGNILHDAHTAILMREHGIRRICTRDTDFHRFAFLEVVDPL
ncbi:MAG: PIN domain-containing protein [Alphaproteobacteria bacterium]|nr:PIN domain-containing protein [Alphaproteobacteria bacterium]MBV9693505.1 PIN domain-containing protein [Alphaproteobacteria bacterium]